MGVTMGGACVHRIKRLQRVLWSVWDKVRRSQVQESTRLPLQVEMDRSPLFVLLCSWWWVSEPAGPASTDLTKTKELILYFRKTRKPLTPVSIHGVNVDIVDDYKYLGVNIDNKLDWVKNTTALYKKCQSCLYHLRWQTSFNICWTMLRISYNLLWPVLDPLCCCNAGAALDRCQQSH